MTYIALFYAATFTLVFNSILTPVLIYIAHRQSWYDEVSARKIHTENVPRIGGIGIFLSTIAGGIFYWLYTAQEPDKLISLLHGYTPLIISVLLIHFIGLIDDFKNIKARYKLVTQIVISIFIVFSGHYFKNILVPFTNNSINLSFFGPVITVIWIIGITNAINLIDGLDGLAGGVSAIIFLFLGLISYKTGNDGGVIITFLLFSSTISFLFFNSPPAKIFMGDSGSLFIGLMIAVLPLYILSGNGSISSKADGNILILSATFIIIPILDTFSAILRRKNKGKPFYIADKSHIHHRLLLLGLSNKSILLLIYGVTVLASLMVFWWVVTKAIVAFCAIIVVWIMIISLFLFVYKKSERKNKFGIRVENII